MELGLGYAFPTYFHYGETVTWSFRSTENSSGVRPSSVEFRPPLELTMTPNAISFTSENSYKGSATVTVAPSALSSSNAARILDITMKITIGDVEYYRKVTIILLVHGFSLRDGLSSHFITMVRLVHPIGWLRWIQVVCQCISSKVGKTMPLLVYSRTVWWCRSKHWHPKQFPSSDYWWYCSSWWTGENKFRLLWRQQSNYWWDDMDQLGKQVYIPGRDDCFGDHDYNWSPRVPQLFCDLCGQQVYSWRWNDWTV